MEAEILCRSGSAVNVLPSSRAKPFFLVLSVGHCKFCLSPSLIEHLLQAVLGGFSRAFDAVQLSDRVFRFSVASQLVGFHIYNLRSFECVDFKVFFHLWHNEGPNYLVEYHNWCFEEAAQWKESAKRKTVHLTGANSVPIFDHRLPQTSNSMAFSNFKRQINVAHNSEVKSTKSGHNSVLQKSVTHLGARVLGPVPDPNHIKPGFGPLPPFCSKCLSVAHSRSSCRNSICRRRCLKFGHAHYSCIVSPRSPPLPLSRHNSLHSRIHRDPGSLNGGPQRIETLKFYPSFIEYIRELSGLITIPSPITVIWLKPS